MLELILDPLLWWSSIQTEDEIYEDAFYEEPCDEDSLINIEIEITFTQD
jgi:hypothetical protein|tara:strand:- start:940 stop:1086 length:147 start_codon:yes stop_codon:yes gene_type:complete